MNFPVLRRKLNGLGCKIHSLFDFHLLPSATESPVITGSAKVPLAHGCKCTITPAYHFNADVPSRSRFGVGQKLLFIVSFLPTRALQPHNKPHLLTGTLQRKMNALLQQLSGNASVYVYFHKLVCRCSLLPHVSVWTLLFTGGQN